MSRAINEDAQSTVDVLAAHKARLEAIREDSMQLQSAMEEMDEFLALDLNCLSLQVNKAEAINMEEAVTEVVVESYDARTIWNRSVAETGLDAEPAALLWAEIEMKGIENE